MPFCPSCNAEYRDGFVVCAKCAVELVENRPLEPPPTHTRWAHLCTTSSEIEASLIQGFLDSEGIACTLESTVFHVEPVTFGGLGRVRLHVHDTDLEQARALLHQIASEARSGCGTHDLEATVDWESFEPRKLG